MQSPSLIKYVLISIFMTRMLLMLGHLASRGGLCRCRLCSRGCARVNYLLNLTARLLYLDPRGAILRRSCRHASRQSIKSSSAPCQRKIYRISKLRLVLCKSERTVEWQLGPSKASKLAETCRHLSRTVPPKVSELKSLSLAIPLAISMTSHSINISSSLLRVKTTLDSITCPRQCTLYSQSQW